jgi:hypothetical protein
MHLLYLDQENYVYARRRLSEGPIMPRTSRGLMLVQAVLAALVALASMSTLGDVMPARGFQTFVVGVAAAQAAVTFYAYGAGSMSHGLLIAQTVMAGALVVASSAQQLADVFGSTRWLALFVMVVNASQAGLAWYVKYASAMPGDPVPVSELPPVVKRLVPNARAAIPPNTTPAA